MYTNKEKNPTHAYLALHSDVISSTSEVVCMKSYVFVCETKTV